MHKPCLMCGALQDRTRALFCFPCAFSRTVDPVARKAHSAVTRAVQNGTLPRAKTLVCVDCGKPAFDYDHREYSKPLEVVPVCRACNKKRGPAIDSLAPPQAAQAQG